MIEKGRECGEEDGRERIEGWKKRLKGGGRKMRIGEDNIKLVEIIELSNKGNDEEIEFREKEDVENIGVKGIGKINRSREERKRDKNEFRSEEEEMILKKLKIGVLKKLLRIVEIRKLIDGMEKKWIGVGIGRNIVRVVGDEKIIVNGVGRKEELRDIINLESENMKLDKMERREDDGGMDGEIIVMIRSRDIIIEK